MIIKKKLRDLTKEDFEECCNLICVGNSCKNCIFRPIKCRSDYWEENKKFYANEFLDQEIVVKNDDILTPQEKNYLEAVIQPFRDRINYIKKVHGLNNSKWLYISFYGDDGFDLPYFDSLDIEYKDMVRDKKYTLKELEL